MEVVIAVVALLFVLSVAAGTYAAVKAVRAVQRGVERTGIQVRRTVEETGLRARSAQPGPVGELARVRLSLRTSIDSTRRALEAGAVDDPSLQEAVGLLDRLHEHARRLDGELSLLMAGEPDKVRIAERLPEARERVTRIRSSADSLRFAAQDRARRGEVEGFDALQQQIEIEAGALRHWEDTARGGHAQPGPAVDPRARDPRALDWYGPTAEGAPPPSAAYRPDLEKGRPHSAP